MKDTIFTNEQLAIINEFATTIKRFREKLRKTPDVEGEASINIGLFDYVSLRIKIASKSTKIDIFHYWCGDIFGDEVGCRKALEDAIKSIEADYVQMEIANLEARIALLKGEE